MAYCPKCNTEQPGNFCQTCGTPLIAAPPATPVVNQSRGDTGVDRSVSQTVVVVPGGSSPPPAMSSSTPDSLPWDYCPIDGRFVRRDETFRCRQCGRGHICTDCRDAELRVCVECAAALREQAARERAAQEARRAAEEAARRTPVWQQIGIELVAIPAGEFLYGEDNQKAHLAAYRLGRTPVTNAQYKAFVDATGQAAPSHWTNGQIPKGKENHPVVNVSFDDAQAFCEWAGVRLPTEQEWEKGARGTDGRNYPWGGAWQLGRCNSAEANIGDTTPVDRYPNGASPYGLLDMAGNVWEWCDTWYDGERMMRVLRGRAFYSYEYYVRCAFRDGNLPNFRDSLYGFRVCAPPI